MAFSINKQKPEVSPRESNTCQQIILVWNCMKKNVKIENVTENF